MEMRAHLIEIEIKIDHWQSTQRSIIISNYVICQIRNRSLSSIVVAYRYRALGNRPTVTHRRIMENTRSRQTHLLPAANTDTRQLISHCVAASACVLISLIKQPA